MTYITHSPEETTHLAEKLAGKLHKGDCIALVGDMGAGKTVFVQGLAHGLGITDYITSPTFSLMNMYNGLYHYDLYRLNEQEVIDSGLDEFFFDKKAISVVEWPVLELLPPKTIHITIRVVDESTRSIEIDNSEIVLEDK